MKKKLQRLKSTVTEMKNILNSLIDWIWMRKDFSELEYMQMEIRNLKTVKAVAYAEQEYQNEKKEMKKQKKY